MSHFELYHKTINTPAEERLGMLIGQGYTHDQAADYIAYIERQGIEKVTGFKLPSDPGKRNVQVAKFVSAIGDKLADGDFLMTPDLFMQLMTDAGK